MKDADAYVAQLQRRLQLSRELLLDVVVRETEYDYAREKSDILFDILLQVSVDRWRSLKILHSCFELPGNMIGRMNGTFTSLKLIQNDASLIPDWFFKFIAQSSSNVEKLAFVRDFPDCLQNPSFLRNVKEATLRAIYYDKVGKAANLDKVTILDSHSLQ